MFSFQWTLVRIDALILPSFLQLSYTMWITDGYETASYWRDSWFSAEVQWKNRQEEFVKHCFFSIKRRLVCKSSLSHLSDEVEAFENTVFDIIWALISHLERNETMMRRSGVKCLALAVSTALVSNVLNPVASSEKVTSINQLLEFKAYDPIWIIRQHWRWRRHGYC